MYEASIKQQLKELTNEIKEMVGAAEKAVPAFSGQMASDWLNTCKTCENRLEDDLLRMAVVGTIKSGKSTFINSLFSDDYLKRGAGVITSIVTKVRASRNLRAILYFKSWDEINREIEQSLRIFPIDVLGEKSEHFDIRSEKDRTWLQKSLEALESRYLLSNDTRNLDHVVLGAYLKGYHEVKDIVSGKSWEVFYENDEFVTHRKFTGDENLSAFVKDIHLEIRSDKLEKNIEIADCQGSDSPNPLHLAMIQDYLQTADLVVYIISSRTGLRQADIKFLSMIKNMAGINHVLFVVNSDFNEHDSIEDLRRVSDKVREELELIVLSPSIYVFSSLLSLFTAKRKGLPQKDRMRLEQWEMDEDLVFFSKNEEKRFLKDFRKMITEQRFSILLKTQVYYLNLLVSDLKTWLNISREFLLTNGAGADELLDEIGKQQQHSDRMRTMIKDTLDGAVYHLKKNIKSDADKFFDIRNGDLVPKIIEFIHGYTVSYDQYKPMLEKGGFPDVLFSVFQVFKQDLDRYMAENINPVLLGYIRKKEEEIVGHFESVAGSYRGMTFETSGNDFSFKNTYKDDTTGKGGVQSIDLSSVKKDHGLSFPSAAATMDYTSALKTEAFMKLGFYRLANTFKKVFKRSKNRGDRDIPALKAGVRKMKKETEASLIFYFKNYRENIKHQYFFKLAEIVSKEMFLQLVNRPSDYANELSILKNMAAESQNSKPEAISDIESIQDRLSAVKDGLEKIDSAL